MSTINLIGYFNYDFGIAKNAKYFSEILSKYNIPHNCLNVNTSGHIPTSNKYSSIQSNLKFLNCINIFFIVDKALLYDFINSSNVVNPTVKNCVFFVIEINSQIYEYIPILKAFDFIFVPSTFVKSHVEKHHPNVILFPIVKQDIPILQSIPFRKKIICLYTFDVHSCPYRKNIHGVIQVIEKIQDDRFFFIIKVSNLHVNPGLKDQLNMIQNKNVIIISDLLSDNDLQELYNISDIYLGLQRCEGFGFTLYDAVQKNKYVVSTLYSAPTDFLKDYPKFIPIDFTIVSTKIFPKSFYSRYDDIWADPNIDDCIQKLRSIDINKNIIDLLEPFTHSKIIEILNSILLSTYTRVIPNNPAIKLNKMLI